MQHPVRGNVKAVIVLETWRRVTFQLAYNMCVGRWGVFLCLSTLVSLCAYKLCRPFVVMTLCKRLHSHTCFTISVKRLLDNILHYPPLLLTFRYVVSGIIRNVCFCNMTILNNKWKCHSRTSVTRQSYTVNILERPHVTQRCWKLFKQSCQRQSIHIILGSEVTSTCPGKSC